ncbi:hypothetical protein [Bacillus sp. BP-3]|uniref:hypothetical protein n=1 Tax=Bacillus sp. BP-3 TaxID=3022773 RepID=UPI00232CE441|nr:hypothetical protein [Bacillus sp. BP-3]MDC2863872.1 hypothetical protein [Bacillus sp. BP-3]
MKITASAEMYAKVVEEQLSAVTHDKNIYLARVIELEAENQKLIEENEKLKPKSANK